MKSIAARTLLALFALAVIAGVPHTYAETIQLKLSDGTTTVVLTDPTGQWLSYDSSTDAPGAIGAWNINVTTGIGSAGLGAPAHLDLNSVNTSSSGTSTTLTLMFTQTGMTTPVSAWYISIGGTNTNTSFIYDVFADDLDRAFYTGADALINTITSGNSNFSQWAAGTPPVPLNGSYSLTQRIRITPNSSTSPSSFGGDADVKPIPEPSSLMLLGVGLIGAGTLRRRTITTSRARQETK